MYHFAQQTWAPFQVFWACEIENLFTRVSLAVTTERAAAKLLILQISLTKL